MKSQKMFLSLLVCMTLSALLSACSDGFKTVSQSLLGTESLDDGVTNQAPKINCDLFLNGSATPYRHISTISSTDTFTENAKEGDTISFDCSATEDEESIDDLSFSMDKDYSASNPDFASTDGKSFTINPIPVGRYPFAIKVVDREGNERIKPFTVVVECLNAQVPVLDVSKVHVSATSKLNYFNYSIDPGAVTGGTGFQYAWDFNGDYVFDPVSLTDPNNIWTSNATLNNIYSPFVTDSRASRQISVKVKNNCEKEVAYTLTAHFPGSNIARNASSQATEKSYYYLQSDISTTGSDLTNQRKNADLLVTQYPEDEKLKRIECDYKKLGSSPASFTMKAENYYKSGSEYIHGMDIQIGNIKDNGSTGTQEFTDAILQSASYRVSAADDGFVSEQYSKKADCPLTMRIKRAVAQVPCKNGPDVESQTITILGEFACPVLTDANTNQSVQAMNSKFYCEVAKIDACVGGGGGGGGGEPPPEQ